MGDIIIETAIPATAHPATSAANRAAQRKPMDRFRT